MSTPPSPDEPATALSQQLRELTAELAEEKARSARLECGILAAASREQERLAQTLHDTISQSLSGMHLMAAVLARKYEPICPAAAAEIAAFSDLIQSSALEMHHLVRSLRPAPREPVSDP